MTRLLLLFFSLAASLAATAAAQTTPAEVFPLDEGNRWVFVGSSSWSAPSGYGTRSRGGSTEWVVDGTAVVDGATLPRLRMTFTPVSGDPATRACAVGAVADGELVSFPFYDIPGESSCLGPANYGPFGEAQDGFQVDLADLVAEDLVVGGTVVDAAPTYSASYNENGDDGIYRAVVGVGFVSRTVTSDFGPGARFFRTTLRRAEVAGEVYGSALDPGEGFFPVAEGDTWTFGVGTKTAFSDPYTPDGYVRWTVEAGTDAPVLRVDRIEDGVRTTLGACVVTVTPATARNGYRQTVALGDAPGADCPGDVPYALPNRDPITLWSGSATERAGLFIDAFRADRELTLGGSVLQTDVVTGGEFRIGLNVPSVATSWVSGRGIGVVRYEASRTMTADIRYWRATAEYARVGGVEYGANPVSEEPPPTASALGLTVAPNPSRGAVRLTLSGDATARVTVFDALGRAVRSLDAMPGTVDLRLDGLGAGVYLVRAETERGAASTRLTVVR